jgi:hypothetical protein
MNPLSFLPPRRLTTTIETQKPGSHGGEMIYTARITSDSHHHPDSRFPIPDGRGYVGPRIAAQPRPPRLHQKISISNRGPGQLRGCRMIVGS